MLPGTPLDYNISKEEWLVMRGIAESHNIIVKEGYCVGGWD